MCLGIFWKLIRHLLMIIRQIKLNILQKKKKKEKGKKKETRKDYYKRITKEKIVHYF